MGHAARLSSPPCCCLRRDVRVHLTDQTVDERSVSLRKNEIRRLWVISAAEVVGLCTAKRRKHLAESVDQIRIALTIGVDDDPE